MTLAVLIGIPLGILITRSPILKKPVLGGANIIQTIPSLAMTDLCYQRPGLARAPTVWRFLRSRYMRCCR